MLRNTREELRVGWNRNLREMLKKKMKKKGNVSKQEEENTQELAKGKHHAGCECSTTEERLPGMCRVLASLVCTEINQQLLSAEITSTLQDWDGD